MYILPPGGLGNVSQLTINALDFFYNLFYSLQLQTFAICIKFIAHCDIKVCGPGSNQIVSNSFGQFCTAN